MILNRFPNRTEILPGWREIACEMSAGQSIGGKDEPIDDEHPGKEQMPLPSHRQPSCARDCGPTGKGADGAIRIPQYACRVERMSKDGRDSVDAAMLCSDWTDGKKRTIPIGTISPIECR